MTTKTELVALAEATAAGLTVARPEGVQALAMMSDEAFEERLRNLKLGRERIARVQREYMNEDEDYGTIPNTPKPTLFKSGAEKLAQLYGLAARVESAFVAGDGEKTPPLTFNAECYLHIGSFDGAIVAVGHGTANSWEKRYRRDTKVCPRCSQPKIIKSKYDPGWYCLNCKSKFGQNDPEITEQSPAQAGDVREAYDLGVTLLKMSEKRAFVDAVLRATATSGLFTQDIVEDPPETTRDADAGFGPSVAQRAAPEPTVRVTRDAAAAEPVEGKPYEVDQAQRDFDRVLEATGGEEVHLGPSSVEGVERGAHTANANEAQIAEVRRIAGQLGWGSKTLLDFTDSLLELHVTIPEDGRVARSTLTALLDKMSAAEIGRLITALQHELPGPSSDEEDGLPDIPDVPKVQM
jgi:hypothetical protein